MKLWFYPVRDEAAAAVPDLWKGFGTGSPIRVPDAIRPDIRAERACIGYRSVYRVVLSDRVCRWDDLASLCRRFGKGRALFSTGLFLATRLIESHGLLVKGYWTARSRRKWMRADFRFTNKIRDGYQLYCVHRSWLKDDVYSTNSTMPQPLRAFGKWR